MELKKFNWSQLDVRTLSILKDGVRSSVYNNKVKRACYRLYKKIKPLEEGAGKYDLNDINTLTCLSLLAEAYDQMGQIDISYGLIKGCADKIKKELSEILYKTVFSPKMAKADRDKERKILRQKLWCVMIKCHSEYRKGNYTEGLEALSICEHVIFNVLKDENPKDPYKLWGTRARLFYFKGLILSEQGDWNKANFCFREAQFSASERLAEKLKSFKDEKTCREAGKNLRYILGNTSSMDIKELRNKLNEMEITFFRHCMGKLNCFGFARIQRSLGELRQSLHNLRTAELDLADTEESFMLALVNLELGITLRALAGYDVEQLEESRDNLLSCSVEFEKGNQKHYYIRSLIALGTTYLSLAITYRIRKESKNYDSYFKKAEETAKEADSKFKDFRLNKAEETAKQADGKFQDFRGWLWRTELLLGSIELEKGRSYYERQDYKNARQSLEKAAECASRALAAANLTDSDKGEPQKKMEILKGMIESKLALGEIYLELASIRLKQIQDIPENSLTRKGDKQKKQTSDNLVGELKTESTNYLTKARDNFEEVRKISNNIPIYDAVCSLYLSRTFLVWKLYSDAKRELEKWKSYENQIENKTVRDKGKQVENELQKILQEEGSGPLIFKPESELNYNQLKKDLFYWLVKQAEARLKKDNKSINKANIARELGLGSRTALYRMSEGKDSEASARDKSKD